MSRPNPNDWGPCEKRRLGHRHRGKTIKTQLEDGHAQAKRPQKDPAILTP